MNPSIFFEVKTSEQIKKELPCYLRQGSEYIFIMSKKKCVKVYDSQEWPQINVSFMVPDEIKQDMEFITEAEFTAARERTEDSIDRLCIYEPAEAELPIESSAHEPEIKI